jgi:hypothetical protein
MNNVSLASTLQPTDVADEHPSAQKAGVVQTNEGKSSKLIEERRRPLVLQIDRSQAEGKGKTWELLTLILPVLLTGWLTFVSSRSESTIRKDIENQNQILSAQLDLTKDLYKRRFDAYEKLYAQLIALNDKLAPQFQESASKNDRPKGEAARHLALWRGQTADFLKQLDDLNKMNGLHMSSEVERLMGEAWQLGVRGNIEKIRPKIHDVEVQMKSELDEQMVREQQTLVNDGITGKPEESLATSRKAGVQ